MLRDSPAETTAASAADREPIASLAAAAREWSWWSAAAAAADVRTNHARSLAGAAHIRCHCR